MCSATVVKRWERAARNGTDTQETSGMLVACQAHFRREVCLYCVNWIWRAHRTKNIS